MWFENLLVFILFKFKKCPNISGVRVVICTKLDASFDSIGKTNMLLNMLLCFILFYFFSISKLNWNNLMLPSRLFQLTIYSGLLNNHQTKKDKSSEFFDNIVTLHFCYILFNILFLI